MTKLAPEWVRASDPVIRSPAAGLRRLPRLRIGHTYLTQRHLLVVDSPPVCVSCQERLSVEHILIYRAEYIDIRDSCFNVNTVRELFDTVPPVLIISFIRRAFISSHRIVIFTFLISVSSWF